MSKDNGKQQEIMFDEDLFLAVPTSSLIHRKASLADLYVRLNTGRLVKLAHKGGSIDVDRITRLGEKSVNYLYVSKADFATIVSDLVRGAEMLNKLNQVPQDIKLAKFFSIAESVFVQMMHLPLTDESLAQCVTVANEIATNLQTKPDFAKAIATIVSLGDEFAKHSLSTVIAINLLASKMQWDSDKMINTLTQAAFFHDIGFKELPRGLFTKPRVDLTREEVALYMTHPALGVQILSQLAFTNADILRAVQEHHEMPNGEGFPQRLRGDRVYPLAKVLSFANVLSHEMFDKLQAGQSFDVDDVVARLDGVYAKMYGSDLVKKARSIFKKED